MPKVNFTEIMSIGNIELIANITVDPDWDDIQVELFDKQGNIATPEDIDNSLIDYEKFLAWCWKKYNNHAELMKGESELERVL